MNLNPLSIRRIIQQAWGIIYRKGSDYLDMLEAIGTEEEKYLDKYHRYQCGILAAALVSAIRLHKGRIGTIDIDEPINNSIINYTCEIAEKFFSKEYSVEGDRCFDHPKELWKKTFSSYQTYINEISDCLYKNYENVNAECTYNLQIESVQKNSKGEYWFRKHDVSNSKDSFFQDEWWDLFSRIHHAAVEIDNLI